MIESQIADRRPGPKDVFISYLHLALGVGKINPSPFRYQSLAAAPSRVAADRGDGPHVNRTSRVGITVGAATKFQLAGC